MRQHGIPGLGAGICDGSGPLWTGVFGTKRSLGGDAVTPQTMFSVQSCSKMYTATAVMLAAQDGLLALDEPITTYLPDFRINSRFEADPEKRITLRHLLSHTAGFTHEAPVGSNFLVGRGSFEEHCASIADTWLRFPVGHHYEYSNLGIDLAAQILARRSGMSFAEFARRELFEPLGLRRTTFSRRRIEGDEDRAIGHSVRSKRLPVRIPMVGAGGLYASVEDACRFVQFHLAGGAGLLDGKWLREMYSIPFAGVGQSQGYGLGISVTRNSGTTTLGHGGGGFGFLTDMYWVPEAEIGVVVLTNSVDHPLQRRLVGEIIDGLVTRVRSPASLPRGVGVPPETRRRFLGEYYSERAGRVTISGVDSRLVLRDDQQHPVRIVANDEIALEDGLHDRYRLLEDGRGDVKYLLRLRTGTVWYRNAPMEGGALPEAEEGLWNRGYVMKAAAVTIRHLRLRAEDGARFVDLDDGLSLHLDAHEPGLYFSCTGEALDSRRRPPTYANVRLIPTTAVVSTQPPG